MSTTKTLNLTSLPYDIICEIADRLPNAANVVTLSQVHPRFYRHGDLVPHILRKFNPAKMDIFSIKQEFDVLERNECFIRRTPEQRAGAAHITKTNTSEIGTTAAMFLRPLLSTVHWKRFEAPWEVIRACYREVLVAPDEVIRNAQRLVKHKIDDSTAEILKQALTSVEWRGASFTGYYHPGYARQMGPRWNAKWNGQCAIIKGKEEHMVSVRGDYNKQRNDDYTDIEGMFYFVLDPDSTKISLLTQPGYRQVVNLLGLTDHKATEPRTLLPVLFVAAMGPVYYRALWYGLRRMRFTKLRDLARGGEMPAVTDDEGDQGHEFAPRFGLWAPIDKADTGDEMDDHEQDLVECFN
ncbi:hypothetical protein BDZ88DRAFT_251943 [Geranomyces variabilis]|nr:hypothetical protein BDZ88DRAFT_251943 [Geranomyces variabilis]KAJ3136447.1 hypothetical protein HDU90_003157 [Geranomyces variabilis]